MKRIYLIALLLPLSFWGCIQRENTENLGGALTAILNSPEGIGILGLDLNVGNIGWTRGCETRTGNFIADSFAWKSGAVVGFMNGGGIRHDKGVSLIPEGTQITQELLNSFLPFNNSMQLVEMNGYRLKQALEGGYNKLLTNKTFSSSDNNDKWGAQHGNCYGIVGDLEGSGRFLHVSSRIKVSLNPQNTPQTVSGSAGAGTLAVSSEGRRVTRIDIDGRNIYNNPSGDPQSGWSTSSGSCVVKSISFSNSSACDRFTVAINNFYASGGDENPSFNPSLAEINNDGSVILLNPDFGVDKLIILEYSLNFSRIFPRVEGRILMP